MLTKLELKRFAYTPQGTIGTVELPDGSSLYTLEDPWKDNQKGVSCIPEGLYTLGLRDSPVVHRTTGGQHSKGWEVKDVPGRTYIMIHPGNTEKDVEGCIAVGTALGVVDGKWAVTNSRAAMNKLMFTLSYNEYQLEVSQYKPSAGWKGWL